MTLTLYLCDETETDTLGRCLADVLKAGDTVLLEGSIGAGKTQFCRALIRARLGRMEDVPSPTFTLVQTYEADVEIWHADLYRLTHPDEALELGLEEAFDQAICLVEWPDRLGSHQPAGATGITLAPDGAGRRATIVGPAQVIAAVHAAFPRAAARAGLLQRAGWDGAEARPLAGDASSRRYDRLHLGDQTRILMDQPPGSSDDVATFARIDRHLRSIGLNAPVIHAEDAAHGYLLLEDYGDGVFARMMAADPTCEGPLYRAAVEVIAQIEAHPPAPGLPDLSVADWAQAAGLVLEWYRFAVTDLRDGGEVLTELQAVLTATAVAPKVMILRDFHAENLMWLPDRQGLQRVGLLDFQLAQTGQPGYDLVSLLQDARREVAPDVEGAMIRHYLDAVGGAEAAFLPRYAALGAQRALRIMGIFARLCLVDGKAQYVRLIPRVWDHLQRNLARPELAGLRAVVGRILPPPTPENLERIRVQCGNFR